MKFELKNIMEDYIQDELVRILWLKGKILAAASVWIHEDHQLASNLSSSYLEKLIERIFENEIDFLYENADDYLELYGEDLFGDEGKELLND